MTNADGPRGRVTTAQWARSLGVPSELSPPPVPGYDEPCPFTAREVAARALILHGVVAAACDVEPEPIADWFREQGLWESVTPAERAFLRDPDAAPENVRTIFQGHYEAQWVLLWVVGKVEHLGLPTRRCDTRRLVDEIIPALGGDVEPFLASARLRTPGELLAESDRHYNLWCYYHRTRRTDPESIPADFLPGVLFQRQYAFEWLLGVEPWDDVQCDS